VHVPPMVNIHFLGFIDLTLSNNILVVAVVAALQFLVMYLTLGRTNKHAPKNISQEKLAAQKMQQNVSLYMLPAIIATVFKYVLEANYGTLNESLRALGIISKTTVIQWLGADLGLWSIVLINVFQWMGFSMMIYYASLMSLPDELYEAAMLDGAGWWRRLFSLTIPSLRGTTSVLIILGIVGSLKTFDIVWLTTGGGPGDSTHFLTTFLYQTRSDRQAGYASAIGMVILLIAFVLAVVQTRRAARSIR